VWIKLTEQPDYSLKVEAELSGTDNGTFELKGTAVANVLFVQGNLAGSPVSVFGYYDAQGRYTGVRNSIAVFDYENLGYEGLLTQQCKVLRPNGVRQFKPHLPRKSRATRVGHPYSDPTGSWWAGEDTRRYVVG
jgi:hypothetical protein